jgi:hypothetical protein
MLFTHFKPHPCGCRIRSVTVLGGDGSRWLDVVLSASLGYDTAKPNWVDIQDLSSIYSVAFDCWNKETLDNKNA